MWKMWLLHPRSRSWWTFKMSVNVCLDYIFWITEHFVTKFGMVMRHRELESGRKYFLLLLLFSRSRSQKRLIWSKYDSFYYTIWSVDPLATKLCLMIHHQKPECQVKKNWIQHSGSRSQWRVKMLIFVQMISSKPPNILFPNIVLWCIVMSQSVMQKDWVAIFKVMVTARAHIKIWQFLCRSYCY